MPERGSKLVDPTDEPLKVEPLSTAGPQPWHADALRWRASGMTVRQVARAVGKGFGPVQRFLNPESKARQKTRQAAFEKQKRADLPEYAEKVRNYERRYMQLKAPERWRKKDEERGAAR